MNRRFFLAALGPASLSAQRRRWSGSQWLEVILERKRDKQWAKIDPGLVLESSDVVRFRFRTNFSGFVYIVNYGTSGSRTLLFPGEATGRENHVAADQEYLVPANGASFRVAGPPGHDVVYWILSPVALGSEDAKALTSGPGEHKPPRLLPRCDDSILRARGECVDSTAGARNVKDPESLPGNLPKLTPRELVIVEKPGATRISAPGSIGAPVVYEFRLAHR
ncbi:MAG: DUF4384 domain-containing protein [Bryobacteraceae bacterium]